MGSSVPILLIWKLRPRAAKPIVTELGLQTKDLDLHLFSLFKKVVKLERGTAICETDTGDAAYWCEFIL